MAQQSRTVLVVEDSLVQAMALQQLLEQHGLTVLRAADGRVGIAMAERHLPDAIVLDIQMPEMDGLQVCRQLHQDPRTCHIPIVMLTAYSEPSVLVQGFDLGAIDFIPKDAFSDQVLVGTLRALKVLDPPPTSPAEDGDREGLS